MFRWVPLNPNLLNPNSWLIQKNCRESEAISPVLNFMLDSKFEGFLVFLFRIKREAPVFKGLLSRVHRIRTAMSGENIHQFGTDALFTLNLILDWIHKGIGKLKLNSIRIVFHFLVNSHTSSLKTKWLWFLNLLWTLPQLCIWLNEMLVWVTHNILDLSLTELTSTVLGLNCPIHSLCLQTRSCWATTWVIVQIWITCSVVVCVLQGCKKEQSQHLIWVFLFRRGSRLKVGPG